MPLIRLSISYSLSKTSCWKYVSNSWKSSIVKGRFDCYNEKSFLLCLFSLSSLLLSMGNLLFTPDTRVILEFPWRGHVLQSLLCFETTLSSLCVALVTLLQPETYSLSSKHQSSCLLGCSDSISSCVIESNRLAYFFPGKRSLKLCFFPHWRVLSSKWQGYYLKCCSLSMPREYLKYYKNWYIALKKEELGEKKRTERGR